MYFVGRRDDIEERVCIWKIYTYESFLLYGPKIVFYVYNDRRSEQRLVRTQLGYFWCFFSLSYSGSKPKLKYKHDGGLRISLYSRSKPIIIYDTIWLDEGPGGNRHPSERNFQISILASLGSLRCDQIKILFLKKARHWPGF